MKSRKIILAFLLIGLLVAVGCRKPEDPEPDYREKWVGEYIGERINWSYQHIPGGIGTTNYDTINESITDVSIWKDSCLNFKPNYYQTYPKINSDGYFRHSLERGRVEGILRNDSLIYSGNYGHSLGFSSGFEFKGKKL